MTQFDAIIIGAGAAGGIVAGLLTEAGKHVLLLERGQHLQVHQVGRDHLRNQRLSVYGHNAGPPITGDPRVLVSLNGQQKTLYPHEPGYHNNAAIVGGGSLIYGAQAWRFMPQDFRMASTYGIPEGSSLADWPLTYEDLEPYYEKAEWQIGVAGLTGGDLNAAPRKKPYPMPPLPQTLPGQRLAEGAKKLGLKTFPVPLLINSQPYNNRPACPRCGMCVGFACLADAKNGSQNTLLTRAFATGRCTLITNAMAERILLDPQGQATGLSYFHDNQRKTASAKIIISSAGAIESARLLLNSPSDLHPRGLGNNADQVGRNLQGHVYSGALGILPDPIFDGLGPGPSIATTDFNHHNPNIIGGGMLANEFIKMPALFLKWHWDPSVPRWGQKAKDYVRHAYPRSLHIQGPIQDIPSPDARVTLDPQVRDQFNMPAVRLSGATHPESIRTSEFTRQKAIAWVAAAGAKKILSTPNSLGLSGGQHQAGTCRMGTNPQTSVTDPFGRIHNCPNVFVIDASLHVTNGGFNPVLTLMALAFRNAEHIIKSL